MRTSRRQLLTATATGLAFSGLSRLAFAQSGLPMLTAAQVQADPYRSEIKGYGPLKADPKGLFDLPEGFSYTVVSHSGQTMSDGLIVPQKADGMGCFALDAERVVLVRNHELKSTDLDISAFGVGGLLRDKVAADRIFDRTDEGQPIGGGTTSLIYDLRKRTLEAQHLSLVGTITNCSGGHTPWGSWLSCEETVQSKGIGVNGDHGWVFEVPSSLRGIAEPAPLKAMGRFKHEAAAVDPRTGVVYMTEDSGDGVGLFYRFLPNDRTKLLAGGRLQALAFKGQPQADPRNWEEPYWKTGDWRDTTWVDMDGVDNPYEDLRYRGHGRGAAWFARGEGLFFGDGELYFTCTNGGAQKLGQIMRYRPSADEGQPGEGDSPGRLQLFVESSDKTVLEMCDNLAVSPWGHLMVCEDRIGGINYLRGVTPKGQIYTVGRNALPGAGDVADNSELAGACFSPDGTTLFLNIYSPGTTIAITGPWSRFQG